MIAVMEERGCLFGRGGFQTRPYVVSRGGERGLLVAIGRDRCIDCGDGGTWLFGWYGPFAAPGIPRSRRSAMRKGRGSCWLFRLLRRWGLWTGRLGRATRDGFNIVNADFRASTCFNGID